MPVDTRTGRPMRRCQHCGTDAYHRVAVAICEECGRWYAACDRCGEQKASANLKRHHAAKHGALLRKLATLATMDEGSIRLGVEQRPRLRISHRRPR